SSNKMRRLVKIAIDPDIADELDIADNLDETDSDVDFLDEEIEHPSAADTPQLVKTGQNSPNIVTPQFHQTHDPPIQIVFAADDIPTFVRAHWDPTQRCQKSTGPDAVEHSLEETIGEPSA